MEPQDASKQIQPLSVHTRKREREGEEKKEGWIEEMLVKKVRKEGKLEKQKADRGEVERTQSER